MTLNDSSILAYDMLTPLLVVNLPQDPMNGIMIIVPGPSGAVVPPPAAALPTVQTIVTPKQLCVPALAGGE